MSAVVQDLRYGARLLFRAPVFTAIAIATLAIGIGANTAIFSVVNTLLLRQLPYADADRLAVIWEHNLPRDRQNNVVSPGNFIHWREMNGSFEDMAAVGLTFRTTLTGGGDPEELQMQFVSAQFFDILGVRPALGRAITSEEDRPGSNVAVISDRLWRRRFGADPAMANRAITLQGITTIVVGVMPPGFSFLDKAVDVWLPIGFRADARVPRGRWLQVVGKLKPGVTIGSAQADMQRVAGELTRRFPDFNTGWTARVVGLREQLTGDVRPALFVLLGAVGFVLLIACANVANLLLARATARQRELAVRAALGAARGRLVRQLVAESLVLACAGGAVGILLAWWAVHYLRTVAADQLPVQRLEAVALDGSVLMFTVLTTILSGLIFGAAPALTAAGGALTDALKEGGRTGSASRGNRVRSAFVVVQVALALVLLTGAGLLVRSFARLIDVEPGFDAARTITMRINLPGARYRGQGLMQQFFDRFFTSVDGIPGVESAGAISFLPLDGLGSATSYGVVGAPKPPLGEEPVTNVRVIVHDYLQAMGVPLLRGRLFNDNDPSDARGKIVISESMARTHWPNEEPIGKRVVISWGDPPTEDEVIGVVGNVHYEGLDTTPRHAIYWPFPRNPYGAMTVAVRTAMDPDSVITAVVDLVRRQDPLLAVAEIRTMETVVSESVAQRRLTMLLLGVFAGAALLLAGVGIYGVIAYSVTQRWQEIGIRMALGARAGDVLKMIVGEAATLAAVGITAGAAGAFFLTRLMRGLLFDVEPHDPVTFIVVATLLASIALIASYLPGRRATRVDPAIALRAE
jgi:putative ABC transport system permease protein